MRLAAGNELTNYAQRSAAVSGAVPTVTKLVAVERLAGYNSKALRKSSGRWYSGLFVLR
jgi:hypothetical protein